MLYILKATMRIEWFLSGKHDITYKLKAQNKTYTIIWTLTSIILLSINIDSVVDTLNIEQ